MRDGFRDNYPDDPLAVRGSLLNKLGIQANADALERHGGYTQYARQGHVQGQHVFPPKMVAVGVVTTIDNTCASSEDPKEGTQAPCRRDRLYKIKLRHYNWNSNRWEQDDDEYPLDLGPTNDLDSGDLIDLPTIPALGLGDLVVIQWDEVRGAWTPVMKPASTLIGKTIERIPARDGTTACSGWAEIFKVDNDLQPIIKDCVDLQNHSAEKRATEGIDSKNPYPTHPQEKVHRPVFNITALDIPKDSMILVVQEHVTGTYWAIYQSSPGLICFKMLDDRTREQDASGLHFGRANATVQDIAGDSALEAGEEIEIRFCDRLWLGAVKDCEGIAMDFGDKTEQGKPLLYVIECQELAAYVFFKTLEDRSAGTFNQDVQVDLLAVEGNTKAGGFANAVLPPEEFLSREGVPTVRYPRLWFPRALKGAEGVAILDVDYGNTTDNSGMRYRVIQSDQLSPMMQVTHDKFCPLETVAITQYDPMFFFPFGQRPETLATATDYAELASMGGEGFIAWHETADDWAMLQPAHEEFTLMVNYQDPTGQEFGCPTIEKVRAQIMRCKDADPVTVTKQKVIVDIDHECEGQGESQGSQASKYVVTEREICVLGEVGEPTTRDAWFDDTIDVVYDVYDDGECVRQNKIRVAIPCIFFPFVNDQVFCTTDCEEDTGGDPPPQDCGTCDWASDGNEWFITSNDCTGGECNCVEPETVPTDNQFEQTACSSSGGGGTPVCTGTCMFRYTINAGGWILLQDNCANVAGCNCPSAPTTTAQEGSISIGGCRPDGP